MFNDAGIRIHAVEPLTKWLPSWVPGPAITQGEVAFADFGESEVFSMAQALGADLVSLNEFFGTPVDVELASDRMAALCERAETDDLRIALEPMPFSGVSDLACAWDIVRRIDRANAGLVIDAWHFFRKGPDLDLLRSIPGERIFALQLNDAPAEPDGPVKDESMYRRLLPGAGQFDLVAFLRALAPAPEDRLTGPEIFSDVAWRLPAEVLGLRLGDSTRRVLRTAR